MNSVLNMLIWHIKRLRCLMKIESVQKGSLLSGDGNTYVLPTCLVLRYVHPHCSRWVQVRVWLLFPAKNRMECDITVTKTHRKKITISKSCSVSWHCSFMQNTIVKWRFIFIISWWRTVCLKGFLNYWISIYKPWVEKMSLSEEITIKMKEADYLTLLYFNTLSFFHILKCYTSWNHDFLTEKQLMHFKYRYCTNNTFHSFPKFAPTLFLYA